MSSDTKKAAFILFFGLNSFAFAPILVRYAGPTDAILLAAIRTILAFLILWPFYLRYGPVPKASHNMGSWKMYAAGAALGIHFMFWISSIGFTSIASASVLVTAHPIMMILVERFWLKRSFRATAWVGVVLAFIGSALLGYFDHQVDSVFPNPLLGNFLALVAAAMFVIYALFGQAIRKETEWFPYVTNVYGAAAITCTLSFLVLLGLGAVSVEFTLPQTLLAGAGLAIGPQIMGHGSINYALRHISPTLISTLILVEPILASLLGWSLFNELPSTNSLFAMILILAGIVLTWRR